jgi:hypothetical protein
VAATAMAPAAVAIEEQQQFWRLAKCTAVVMVARANDSCWSACCWMPIYTAYAVQPVKAGCLAVRLGLSQTHDVLTAPIDSC